MKYKLFVTSLLSFSIIMGSNLVMAGSKKLMTINAAKIVAERAIIESVIGLKVRSKESVDEMIASGVKIDAKTKASIKGVEYTEIVYDREKDIARVVATIRLGRVSNIIGKQIDFGDRIIKRVGFATSTRAMAGPLKAMRAAELDAYKQLAKKIVGFTLESESTVEDFILKSDTIRTKMMAAIYGAEITGYRWDQDGDAYVKMALRLGQVEDVLGQRIRYQGDVIEVEGAGAQKDDYSEANAPSYGNNLRSTSSQIQEGSLNIPVTPMPERKGTGYPGAPTYNPGGASQLY